MGECSILDNILLVHKPGPLPPIYYYVSNANNLNGYSYNYFEYSQISPWNRLHEYEYPSKSTLLTGMNLLAQMRGILTIPFEILQRNGDIL